MVEDEYEMSEKKNEKGGRKVVEGGFRVEETVTKFSSDISKKSGSDILKKSLTAFQGEPTSEPKTTRPKKIKPSE